MSHETYKLWSCLLLKERIVDTPAKFLFEHPKTSKVDLGLHKTATSYSDTRKDNMGLHDLSQVIHIRKSGYE